MSYVVVSLLGLMVPAAEAKGAGAADLAPPVVLKADGKPIDVEIGHAAPFVGDIDGKRQLLVGQFGEGRLRVYPLEGDKAKPKLGKFEWLKAGDGEARVPAS
jgi:hypothetical protein